MSAPAELGYDAQRCEDAGNLLLLVETLLDTHTPEGVVLWLASNGSLVATGDWDQLHAAAAN